MLCKRCSITATAFKLVQWTSSVLKRLTHVTSYLNEKKSRMFQNKDDFYEETDLT